MIVILSTTRDDGSVLAQLHAACFKQGWSVASFEQLLAVPGTFGLIACQETTHVGFALARVAADEAEILSVGVCDAARRRGVATQILVEAAGRSAAAGAAKLFLEVGRENAAALALYRKLGFRQVGCRAAYYNDGSGDGLTMRADLPLPRLGNGTELD
jgi:[ribosomal protein S18]-alanine N-acetyltransferase